MGMWMLNEYLLDQYVGESMSNPRVCSSYHGHRHFVFTCKVSAASGIILLLQLKNKIRAMCCDAELIA